MDGHREQIDSGLNCKGFPGVFIVAFAPSAPAHRARLQQLSRLVPRQSRALIVLKVGSAQAIAVTRAPTQNRDEWCTATMH